MKRALVNLSKVLGATVIAVAAISLLASFWLAESMTKTLPVVLFFGGLLLMIAAGLVGAGFGERALYDSNLYVMAGSYRNAVHQGRLQRRDEEFEFMAVGFLMGLALMALSFLLTLVLLV